MELPGGGSITEEAMNRKKKVEQAIILSFFWVDVNPKKKQHIANPYHPKPYQEFLEARIQTMHENDRTGVLHDIGRFRKRLCVGFFKKNSVMFAPLK